MSDISIYTHNLRLFYRITKKFRDERLNFHALDQFGDIPPNSKVLLTTQQDLDIYDPVLPAFTDTLILNSLQSADEILLLTCQHLRGIQSFRNMVLAIDPGVESTGIAVLLDNRFIYSREIYDLYSMNAFAELVFATFPNPTKIVKIGNGVRGLTRQYLSSLITRFNSQNNLQYLVVNERGTSRKKYSGGEIFRSTHEKAAMLIGKREGQPICEGDYC